MIVVNWLLEWTNIVDADDTDLNPRLIHAHAGKPYNSDTNKTERLTPANADLFRLLANGNPKPDQERLVLITTGGSYEGNVKILYSKQERRRR